MIILNKIIIIFIMIMIVSRGAKPAAEESAAHIHHVVTEHLAPAFSAASRFNLTFHLFAGFTIHHPFFASIAIYHVVTEKSYCI